MVCIYLFVLYWGGLGYNGYNNNYDIFLKWGIYIAFVIY